MLKKTTKIKISRLIILSNVIVASCATLKKGNIDIPKEVQSRTVIKDIPKEQQKEPETITVAKPVEKLEKKKATLPKPVLRTIKNPFKIGESIRWDLYYIGIRAASLTVNIEPFVEFNGRKAFHFKGVAQTTSLMKYIYRVYDVIDTYVDYEQFIPLKMTLTMDESKQNVSMVLNYDHDKGKAYFWKKRIDAKKEITELKREDEFTPLAQDIFSSLYFMRTHDIKVGDKVDYVVHDNGKNWNMTIEAVKTEKIWTRLGEVEALLLHPTVERAGEKFTKGTLYLWVTNDEKKVPIKFEAEVRIGSLKGYIKDYVQRELK